MRVSLEQDQEGLVATPTSNQSSGVLTSLIRGQGLAIAPIDATVLEAGETVAVQVLDPGFFDRSERGF